jgi:hypothetical protein
VWLVEGDGDGVTAMPINRATPSTRQRRWVPAFAGTTVWLVEGDGDGVTETAFNQATPSTRQRHGVPAFATHLRIPARLRANLGPLHRRPRAGGDPVSFTPGPPPITSG